MSLSENYIIVPSVKIVDSGLHFIFSLTLFACCFISSYAFFNTAPAFSYIFFILFPNFCHKLYSACISTTSKLIFTNQVVLESPKWGLSAHISKQSFYSYWWPDILVFVVVFVHPTYLMNSWTDLHNQTCIGKCSLNCFQ